jgi:hypothetical protein
MPPAAARWENGALLGSLLARHLIYQPDKPVGVSILLNRYSMETLPAGQFGPRLGQLPRDFTEGADNSKEAVSAAAFAPAGKPCRQSASNSLPGFPPRSWRWRAAASAIQDQE